MKANAPKRKVFQDALDLLAEDPVQDTSVAVNGIVSIPGLPCSMRLPICMNTGRKRITISWCWICGACCLE